MMGNTAKGRQLTSLLGTVHRRMNYVVSNYTKEDKVMSRYSVAIVGCGTRGRHHAEAFLKNSDRFNLLVLCDKDRERLQSLSSILNTPKTYTNAEDMLSGERPDVLCFATPPQVRLELVELGVKHGVKAIAYEKPMATSLAEARRIHDLCKEAQVKTIVSHQHKYGSHWRKVKELVDSGEIGEIHTIHATAKGWLLQYGTHLMDYMMFLNGGHRGLWVIGHVHGKGKLSDSHPSPDYAMGQIEFENGVRGIIECGTLAPDQPGKNPFWFNAGATVYGSCGYAQVIVGSGWRAVTKSSSGLISGPGCFDVAKDQPAYIRDLADWLDDSGKIHPCNGEVTYHGFEILMGICLSSLEKRKISLPLKTSEPIIERLGQELPEETLTQGEKR